MFGFLLLLGYLLAYISIGIVLARLVPAFRNRYQVYRVVLPAVLCSTTWLLLWVLGVSFLVLTACLIPPGFVGLLLTKKMVPKPLLEVEGLLDDQLLKHR